MNTQNSINVSIMCAHDTIWILKFKCIVEDTILKSSSQGFSAFVERGVFQFSGQFIMNVEPFEFRLHS